MTNTATCSTESSGRPTASKAGNGLVPLNMNDIVSRGFGSPRSTTRAASSVSSSGVLLFTAISSRLDLFSGIRSAVRVILRRPAARLSHSTVLTRTGLVPPRQVIRVSEFLAVGHVGSAALKGRRDGAVSDLADHGDGAAVVVDADRPENGVAGT